MAVDLATLAIKVESLEALSAQQRLDGLTRSGGQAESAMGRLGGASASCASQLAGVIGVTLSLAGAFALAYKATSSWYSLISGGVSIVDDFQKKIISTSYILTTMSDVKKPDLAEAYGAWKDYFDWMFRESLRVDKAAAASATEIFSVSVEMAKKGVVAATEEEMNTIGRLTDLMKAVTPGYMNFEQQARGEIQAMIEGTARMGAQTAQILSQIDPAFKENIKSAREQGTVLKYIESILPQIKQYTLDLMGTWDAVGASLKSAWSVINLSAFADAHRDVVALATELSNRLVDNGRLTAEGEKLALALGEAWNTAKVSIYAALDYILNNSDTIISDIKIIASTIGTVTGFTVDLAIGFMGVVESIRTFAMNVQVAMVQVRAAISYAIEWFEILGRTAKDVAHGIIWDFGEIAPAINRAYADMAASSGRWANIAIQDANDVRFAVMNSMMAGKAPPGFGIMGLATESPTSVGTPRQSGAPPVPGVRPFAGKESKGGKGGAGGTESAENSLKSFIDTMNSETAKAAGDSEAILNAWYGKQSSTLEKLAAKGIEVSAGKTALDAAYYSKLEKLDSDFQDWYNAGLGNQYEKLVAEEKKKLDTVAGNKAKEAQVIEVYDRKHFELSQQMETDRLSLFKGYLDTMAGLSPMLADQLGYKRESLRYELELADAALERQRREGKITEATYEQAKGMQAVMAQAKKFNLEMENDKGISGWAYGRAKESDQRNTVKDMMGGLESGFQNAFSSGLQGVLTHDKKSLKDIGKTMFEGLIGELHKGATTKLFDSAAKMLRPSAPSGDAASGLSQAAEGLQAASVGFNTNTAQFGLAAGGLLLSGIGIATNSQALVYAGAVLQVAGLAIQLYEALTSTTVTAEMTVAAAALTTSAGGLSAAAVALGSAAAALGGSSGGGILSGLGSIVGTVAGIFLHEGGGIGQGGMIYAHAGWPRLASDEVPIIAQTGERVLSRQQNRDYEAGMGTPGGGGLSIGAIHIDARGASKDINWGHVVKRQIIPQLDRELGRRGYQKIGGGK